MLDKREIILYIRITEREEKRKQEPTEKRKAEKASQMFFSEIRICSFFYLALGFFSAVRFPEGERGTTKKKAGREGTKRRKRAGKLHKGIWQKENRLRETLLKVRKRKAGRERLKEWFSEGGKL